MFVYLSLTCLNEEPSDPLLREKLPPQTPGNLVKKIRLATKYAFWCTNTTMWNSRSKLISTPFSHLRENSSKFRLSGPITAVTHNKSFSDCFSVKIYLYTIIFLQILPVPSTITSKSSGRLSSAILGIINDTYQRVADWLYFFYPIKLRFRFMIPRRPDSAVS